MPSIPRKACPLLKDPMRTVAFTRVLGLTLLATAAGLGAQTGTLAVYSRSSRRRRMKIIFLPAIVAGVIALTPAPAASQGVTAPPGASPMGSTIPVQWNPLFTASPTVNIWLAGYGGTPATLATNVTNNGHASVNLPRPPVVPCEPNRLYQVLVSPGSAAGNATIWSAQFKLICWGGSLTVVKTVINESGQVVPNGAFSVDVTCGPSGPNTTLALSRNNNFRDSLLYIPPGRTCSINETAPKAPAGCRWLTTYPQGKGVDISQSARRLDVHNRLSCQGAGNTNSRSLPTVAAPKLRPPTP